MSDEAHPFVPGTKVAITYRYGGFHEAGITDAGRQLVSRARSMGW